MRILVFYWNIQATRPRSFTLVLVPVYFKTLGLMLYIYYMHILLFVTLSVFLQFVWWNCCQLFRACAYKVYQAALFKRPGIEAIDINLLVVNINFSTWSAPPIFQQGGFWATRKPLSYPPEFYMGYKGVIKVIQFLPCSITRFGKGSSCIIL